MFFHHGSSLLDRQYVSLCNILCQPQRKSLPVIKSVFAGSAEDLDSFRVSAESGAKDRITVMDLPAASQVERVFNSSMMIQLAFQINDLQ